MKRRTAGVVVGMALAAGVAACFPDYAIGSADGGSPGDSGGESDGTTSGGPDARGDAADATADAGGQPPADAGSDGDSTLASEAGGDAPTDSTYALDAGDVAVASGEVVVDGGAFTFPVTTTLNGTITAYANLDYRIAIDRTELTVGEFAAFVEAGLPTPCGGGSCSLDPSGPYAGKMTWDPAWNAVAQSNDYAGASSCASDRAQAVVTWKAPNNANLPVTCVPWQQALAYCAWRGKRLPTDTEYRFFATGGGTETPYPWGSAGLDCQHAISSACTFPVAVGTASAGASKDGVYDLVGSLSEWLWDPCSPGNVYSYPNDAGTDYLGPLTDAGGGPYPNRLWINSDFTDMGAGYFQSDVSGAGSSDTSASYDNCGFRCARTIP